jgi:NADH-quinone oxidoreductase subunit L
MGQLFAVSENPGLWFLYATLLPLASFVLLLLAGGLRQYARSANRGLYAALGGDTPGRGAAYVATAAIGLGFVLSAIGAVQFSGDFQKKEHLESFLRSEMNKAVHTKEQQEQIEDLEKQIAAVDGRWQMSTNWAGIRFGTDTDAPATVLRLGYRVDSLTVIMFLMVTLIATLIHIFSMGYMADEMAAVVEDHQVHTEDGHLHRRGRFGRFFLFLSLFCFSMLNLVLADNLFQVFISWELVGVCSYLLVGFNYERTSASNAANKAFITNRVGDVGFILGLLILWTYIGTFNFEEIFRTVRAPLRDGHHEKMNLAAQFIRATPVARTADGATLQVAADGGQVLLFPAGAHVHNDELKAGEEVDAKYDLAAAGEGDFGVMPYWLLVAAGLGIFLGCMGKSAQFPLHVWLPDAMEGPTPVSALIHAATMVAAGVYLVGRTFPLFTYESRLVIAYVGGITLFMAATIAVVMTDIKKVLAYSTVSQLGYMMLALGVGGWIAGLFHLLTHAFFKALLFLCSGSVIYGCHHEQDMSKMGGLYPKMKVTALTMLVGVLTICGIPLFSGWYSKDAIIAQALGFMLVHPEHVLLLILPLVTAGLTAFYMFRMWFLTFTGEPRDAHVYEHAHESPRTMTGPLVVLAVFSVAVAWGWPLYDAEASYLGQRLHHAQPHHVLADFGALTEMENWDGAVLKDIAQNERYWALYYHSLAEGLALGVGFLGIVFAYLIYKARAFDPAEAAAQFPGVHKFLSYKWYVDELYSAFLVRPALVVAYWARAFDTYVIDGIIDTTGRLAVLVSKGGGWVDLGIVDGLANLIAYVVQGAGARLRTVQTGYLRSYILFLALAVVAIFAILSYFVAVAAAG